jgi:hypothetical protein
LEEDDRVEEGTEALSILEKPGSGPSVQGNVNDSGQSVLCAPARKDRVQLLRLFDLELNIRREGHQLLGRELLKLSEDLTGWRFQRREVGRARRFEGKSGCAKDKALSVAHRAQLFGRVAEVDPINLLLPYPFNHAIGGSAEGLNEAMNAALLLSAVEGVAFVEIAPDLKSPSVDLIQHFVRVLNEIFESLQKRDRKAVGPHHEARMSVESEDLVESLYVLAGIVEKFVTMFEGCSLWNHME